MSVKILLIEDDPNQGPIMAQMLRHNKQYAVLHAPNGMDGLALAIKEQPDLVIVDLRLVEQGDDIDGFQVIRSLRSTPQTAWIGILAWTGHYADKKDEIRALREGADEYVRKGEEVAVLEARIEALLRRVQRP